MIYLRLFFEFFKTGLFAFGGGMATVPFLYDLGAVTGWFTASQLTDMIAVSESTPGPMGVNTATYVGFTTAGIPGAVIATLGLITPSIIVMCLIAGILLRFQENDIVKSVLSGLRPASLGLITAAAFGIIRISLLSESLWRESGSLLSLFNYKAIILAAVVFIAIKKFKGHPILYILGSAVVGIVFKMAG